MSNETDLNKRLASLDVMLQSGTFVFFDAGQGPLPANQRPIMMLKEPGGTTYILPKDDADEIGLGYAFPSKMITLTVRATVEAAGVLARVTTALAKHGMGVNAVSGFQQDHLFVALGREKEALRVLNDVIQVAATQDYDGQTVL